MLKSISENAPVAFAEVLRQECQQIEARQIQLGLYRESDTPLVASHHTRQLKSMVLRLHSNKGKVLVRGPF